MLRPLLALSILLLSLGSIFAVVGIAHSQAGCPRDSMRCGEPMQCPYHGPGLPLFRFPENDGQSLKPEENEIASATADPNRVVDTKAVIEENTIGSEKTNVSEVVESETIVGRPVVTAPVVEPVIDGVPAAVEPADAFKNKNEDTAIVPEAIDETNAATNEDSNVDLSAAIDADLFGYKYVATGDEFVPHIKIPKSRKTLAANVNKRLKSLSHLDLGLQMFRHGSTVRDRISQWTRDYKLDQLVLQVVPPDKADGPSAGPVPITEVAAPQQPLLLGIARGLGQFGALIQGASRHLEALAEDGATLQAKVPSPAKETR